ncbi:MAG: type II toxin-antitoxin system Phd/YefM family antitoxin [Synergistaceae bacterium]|nr:type II toxin-antitoxin system Phd/YefM family antitoxin [Synergistaceae bacterium]
MTAITAKRAHEKFFQLLSEVNDSSAPVIIVSDEERKNAVLVSEEEWNSLQETLYLYSIPGMVESILEARKEPLSECKEYDPDRNTQRRKPLALDMGISRRLL